MRLLSDGDRDLAAVWVAEASASLGSRVSAAEVDRELRELYEALVAALREGAVDVHSEQMYEVRALVTELSRNRARQGFSPSETAIGVFALKRVLEPLLADGSAEEIQAYLRLGRILDGLGLFTIETYTQTREELITAQAEQLLELSTPVVR
ncbi:RsbRD N-terminal domain-containing protein [Streptomyces sp. NPDC007157]|uniref:RsbRD N-terminal domain-containing protein n=1 Tax=Streptomyces sp. NPDC007157 TaxID=3154681 RepID=UPI0033EEC8E3